MEELAIELENERLRSSWNCFPEEVLADYLSVGEQDQRINAHSTLTRSLLVDTLWPGKFDALIEEEMRFGVILTWLLQKLENGVERGTLLDAIDACASGPDDPGIPEVVRDAAVWLQSDDCPILDYISEALIFANEDHPESRLGESALDTFITVWDGRLSECEAEPVSVLELACGSGNDYQAIHASGIGRCIDYSGFDISWKNVSNARIRFPGVNFFEASILNSGLPDASHDYVFAHDVIGHLSGEGMEQAVREVMRIARREAWIHCFNAVDIEDHEIRPFKLYHKNRVSIPRMRESLEAAGAANVDVIPISAMLEEKFGFRQEYTATSATFIATKGG